MFKKTTLIGIIILLNLLLIPIHASEEAEEVILKTNMGEITLELYPKIAPKTVENFVTHVKNGYYDGIIFHRIIENFMIQGGDPTGTGRGGESIWDEHFEDEINAKGLGLSKTEIAEKEAQGYKYRDDLESMNIVRGVIAMANAGPNTNGSQFFIVTRDKCEWLDGNHTVFGKVIDGMDIVDKIEKVKTDANGKPDDEVKIIKAKLK
ncbi:MAG: peptidylprolyl isomerase [Candidatus Muiribacteriota bacterium]